MFVYVNTKTFSQMRRLHNKTMRGKTGSAKEEGCLDWNVGFFNAKTCVTFPKLSENKKDFFFSSIREKTEKNDIQLLFQPISHLAHPFHIVSSSPFFLPSLPSTGASYRSRGRGRGRGRSTGRPRRVRPTGWREGGGAGTPGQTPRTDASPVP